MLRQFHILLLCLGLSPILLGGCESFRNTFGLDHYQPDEFKVSDNPPLSVPKEYKLRPPQEGRGNSTNSISSDASALQAQQALLGTQAKGAVTKSSSEQALLSMAGSKQTPAANIRETVNQEAAVSTDVSGSLVEKIRNWKEEFKKNANSLNEEKVVSSEKAEAKAAAGA